MKYFLITCLLWLPFTVFGQEQPEAVLYVIDSIPIIDTPPEDRNNMQDTDIDHMRVFTDKIQIDSLGYADFDKVIYIFTKSYATRPDSIKQIPVLSTMYRGDDNKWRLKEEGTPYTGPVTEYYLSGSIYQKGYVTEGLADRESVAYYPDGKVKFRRYYRDGKMDGKASQYYPDGTIQQEGEMKNGKESGVWKKYFSDGTLQQISTYNKNGKLQGEAITYYSTGEVKFVYEFENGVARKDRDRDKALDYFKRSQTEYLRDPEKGIRMLDKAIGLKPDFAQAYFSRGTMYLNSFEFNKAIADLTKAIEIEPTDYMYYSNRAFARLRKSQYEGSREISQGNGITILAGKDNDISESERKLICEDLKKGIELGDTTAIVIEAYSNHCE